MSRWASAMVVALAAVILSGCMEEGSSGKGEEDAAAGPSWLYVPINHKGVADLVPPSPAPRDTSPACQMSDVATPHRVLDLAGSVAWEPTSERTRVLRLALVPADAGDRVAVEGPSPLDLDAPAFNVSAGERFGIVLSLIGEEPLDPLTDPQEFRFDVRFVARLEPGHEDTELGFWSTECP